MANLHSLSRIGFGGYRVSADSKEHYDALLYALASGCNLIDTSANYMNGESEKLIGKVLRQNPQYDSFVMTKAGYIQGHNLIVLEDLNKRGLAKDDLVFLSDQRKYSIHPDFLNEQVELSCKRLQRKCIDGFLLHNPEYYFEQQESEISQEDYYVRIKRAFQFLEEKVSEGKIRYYGISSNTFPLSTLRENTTNLHKVLDAADEVTSDSHFKLIQFPFNLVENEAIKPLHGNSSLIELAKARNVVTFSNRPLNANTDSGALRIATYEEYIQQLNEEDDWGVFYDSLKLIRSQLQKSKLDNDVMDFTVIRYLNENWMKISTPEAVIQIFSEHFFPLLYQLYEGSVPEQDMRFHLKLYEYSLLYSKKSMTHKAIVLQREMIRKGIIGKDDTRSLPVIACETYINSGIDHVLVGMRNTKYVDGLKTLFWPY